MAAARVGPSALEASATTHGPQASERPQAFATLRAPEFDCAIRTGGGEHLPIWAKRDSVTSEVWPVWVRTSSHAA